LPTKRESLRAVAAEVIVCAKCPLSRSRKNAVPGAGDRKSRIMLVGEAPGRSEDAKGEPFVGAAGKLLDSLLSEIGLSRKKVFITNVVKCRPPRNRQPLPNEIKMCTPYLDRQVRILKPIIIVTLGNHSSAYIFSKANMSFDTITKAHGWLYEASLLGLCVKIFPTFHPAAALYNGQYRRLLQEDFHKLRHHKLDGTPL